LTFVLNYARENRIFHFEHVMKCQKKDWRRYLSVVSALISMMFAVALLLAPRRALHNPFAKFGLEKKPAKAFSMRHSLI
jgi:hypothetical protein